MSLKTIQKSMGCALALLVLLSALVGYLPTSHCHCRDPKPSKEKKVACPFGQLRSLLISILTDPVSDFVVELNELSRENNCRSVQFLALSLISHFDAQAPPV